MANGELVTSRLYNLAWLTIATMASWSFIILMYYQLA